MPHHVIARVAGFGWTLLPFAPYRFEQVPADHPVVDVFHDHPEGPQRARLHFHGGAFDCELGPGTEALNRVVDVFEGPRHERWLVETAPLVMVWPAGFALCSWPIEEHPGYGLHGPDDSLLWVQGPSPAAKLPPVDALVGPGQAVRLRGQTAGRPWVELSYLHEGQPWVQRHYVVVAWPDGDFVLVSAQAPEAHSAAMARAADEVAASLAPRPGEPPAVTAS